MDWVGFEPTASTLRRSQNKISKDQLNEYVNIVELSGITDSHKKEVIRALKTYLKYTKWTIDKTKSLEYFKLLKNRCSVAYYKKQMFQIKKFLRYNDKNWVDEIKLPPDPDYDPKRISNNDILITLDYFKNDINYNRYRALILLGYSSGLRAEELYGLTINDIDFEKRKVFVRHDPKTNHSTKTRKSRISFFTNETKEALLEYFNTCDTSKTLFPQTTMIRAFKRVPIRVKDLRKAFSQKWTRRQGDSGVKKILMGHSLKNDIDLMHYNAQSEEDLKRIYDRVMNN